MNNQESPGSGVNQNDARQADLSTPDSKMEDVLNSEAEVNYESLQEDDFDEDEFSEDEFLDDDEDDFDEDDEDDEESRAKSLIEELFDEGDLVIEMSEFDVLTLEDAAEYLQVELGAIRRLMKEQGLPGRKIGDEWRFLRGAIADWLRAPAGAASSAGQENAFADRSGQRDQQHRQKNDRRREHEQGYENRSQQGTRNSPPRGGRYPQQGEGTRYPQEGRPRRRYQSEDQSDAASQGGGSYPPPRRPRYGDQQNQQSFQDEYRPPRRSQFGGAGNFENQSGGQGNGKRFTGGPKKPKRKALNEQRFKRLDRRKFGDNSGQNSEQDFDNDQD